MSKAAELLRTRLDRNRITRLLADAGLHPRREHGRDDDGAVVLRCSGYVIANGDQPESLRISYVHDEGDERTEAGYHDRIGEVLRADGLLTFQVDAPACRNVAVEVQAARPLDDGDWALLAAVGQGRIVRAAGRWKDLEPHRGERVSTSPMPGLMLSGYADVDADGTARLTEPGRGLLASRVFVPAEVVDLTDFA